MAPRINSVTVRFVLTFSQHETYSSGVIKLASTESLFYALGGPPALGRAIETTTQHPAGFKRRGRIPPAYWPKLLRALRAEGYDCMEADLIAIYNAGRPHAASSSAAEAAS